ncbi:MAG: hypothetical protein AAF677_10515 [Pseudomonadota bacterium]
MVEAAFRSFHRVPQRGVWEAITINDAAEEVLQAWPSLVVLTLTGRYRSTRAFGKPDPEAQDALPTAIAAVLMEKPADRAPEAEGVGPLVASVTRGAVAALADAAGVPQPVRITMIFAAVSPQVGRAAGERAGRQGQSKHWVVEARAGTWTGDLGPLAPTPFDVRAAATLALVAKLPGGEATLSNPGLQQCFLLSEPGGGAPQQAGPLLAALANANLEGARCSGRPLAEGVLATLEGPANRVALHNRAVAIAHVADSHGLDWRPHSLRVRPM